VAEEGARAISERIERCLARIREEYAGDKKNLTANQTKQDAIILNLQRACETSIDLAIYVISQRRLCMPQDSRDAFALLQTAGIILAELAPACNAWSASATSRCTNTLV
jgi:uncharacterized protein YutE (UPF0331/DUF86 family)